MLHLNTTSSKHTDIQPSRIAKDEADVKALLLMLEESWINPFNSNQQERVCLSTGKLATPEIANDLIQAKALGEKPYKLFRENRLDSNPPKSNCYDKLTKPQLKTFGNLSKKIKVRGGTSQELIIKADRALFAQRLIIAENRKMNISDVLCHPLGPLTWSLASADGSLRKTNKSSLLNDFKKNIPAANTIPQPSARVIDGMSLVQKIKGDQDTFDDVAESLMSMILNEGNMSERIDVVFDVYRDESTKNVEREKRGSGSGHKFKKYQVRP